MACRLRHRQTKETATVEAGLRSPRHISTPLNGAIFFQTRMQSRGQVDGMRLAAGKSSPGMTILSQKGCYIKTFPTGKRTHAPPTDDDAYATVGRKGLLPREGAHKTGGPAAITA